MKDRLLGRVIADRYRLESRLGVGGMGAVYRARHLLIDRVVAIKILQPERRGEEHFRAWFLREARAANRVNHANIVDINDFGETEDGLAYLVMELLVGEALSNYIMRGPMDMAVSADILEQVTAALARAHDLGVVHRDVKPDNIYLINRGGRRNFVKLLDFGLARLSRDGRLAAKGAVFGTPEYMSPEQARGEDASPFDLYSLGIIFYEMATGRLPFSARDRDEFIENHKKTLPPSPDKFVPDLDPRATKDHHDPARKRCDEALPRGHHLLEEFKALQRHVGPISPWETSDYSGLPSYQIQAQLPRAIDEMTQWALRASIFGRMVALTYPNGNGPAQVPESLNTIWRLAAAAIHLDGELQAEAKNNENLERRGRDFRAQVGRRIEDLAREQSRLKREIAAATNDLSRLRSEYDAAGEDLATARNTIAAVDKDRDEMSTNLRAAYELAGAAAARRQARAEAITKVEAKIRKWREECDRIDSQLEAFKKQLHKQSSTADEDLAKGRARLAQKAQQREEYNAALHGSATFLETHFKDVPQCKSLMDELTELNNANPKKSSDSLDRAVS